MASLAETGEIEVEFLDFPDKWQVFQFEEDSELVVIESEQGHGSSIYTPTGLGGTSNVLGHYIVKCTVFLLTTVMELCQHLAQVIGVKGAPLVVCLKYSMFVILRSILAG